MKNDIQKVKVTKAFACYNVGDVIELATIDRQQFHTCIEPFKEEVKKTKEVKLDETISK